EAVAAAAPGDVVSFSPALFGQTIVLSSRLVIDRSLSIDGPGASLLSVSGNSTTGLISIAGSPRVSIDGLTLTRGSDVTAGAIATPAGSLFLRYCDVTRNTAFRAAGAISSGGQLVIERSSFTYNSVPFGSGGAISNSGEAVIAASVFASNSAGVRGYAVYG